MHERCCFRHVPCCSHQCSRLRHWSSATAPFIASTMSLCGWPCMTRLYHACPFADTVIMSIWLRIMNSSVKSTALVIWFLSRHGSLAHLYLLGRRRKRSWLHAGASPATVCMALADMYAEPGIRARVKAALRDPSHPLRLLADAFLVESVLAEHIAQQNQKGLTVDLTQAILKYVSLWHLRPSTNAMTKRLSRLVWSRSSRRAFGRTLRFTWRLSSGLLRKGRDLAGDEISRRVLPWQAWVHSSPSLLVLHTTREASALVSSLLLVAFYTRTLSQPSTCHPILSHATLLFPRCAFTSAGFGTCSTLSCVTGLM